MPTDRRHTPLRSATSTGEVPHFLIGSVNPPPLTLRIPATPDFGVDPERDRVIGSYEKADGLLRSEQANRSMRYLGPYGV